MRSGAARHLIAGAAAGVVSNTVVAPLDILRLNLICSNTRTNALEVARSIYSQGGLRAFWRGNTADVLRTIPSSAVRFYSFAVYKAGLPALFQSAGVQAANLAVVSLLAGGFAGMTAMALLFPLETVRTQMATQGATDLSVYTYMDCINRGDHMRIGTTSCFLMTSVVPCVQYVACTLAEIDVEFRGREQKKMYRFENLIERRMARCGALLHCLARCMLKDVDAVYAVLGVEIVDSRLRVLRTRTCSLKDAEPKLIAAFDAERAKRRTVNEFTHNVVLICDSTPNVCLLNSLPWDIPGATDLTTTDYVDRINCGQYMLVDFATLRAVFMVPVGGVTPKAPDCGAAAPQAPAKLMNNLRI